MKTIITPFALLQKEKISAIEHILYEVEMLYYAKNRFIEAKKLGKGWVEESILIECFLLHYRNLSDFFLKDRSTYFSNNQKMENDDIVCWDFNFQKVNTFLIGNIGDINKTISHLTYSRVKDKIIWNIWVLWEEILNLSKKFIEHLIANQYIIKDDQNYQKALIIKDIT